MKVFTDDELGNCLVVDSGIVDNLLADFGHERQELELMEVVHTSAKLERAPTVERSSSKTSFGLDSERKSKVSSSQAPSLLVL